MSRVPYDQRLARVLVRPLVRARLHPNVVTAACVLLALLAALGFASADAVLANWAAGVFVLSRFLDHFDGELARQSGTSSRLGYLLDYAAGGISYGAMFTGIAWGQYQGELGGAALVLGGIAAAAALIAVVLNIGIDSGSQAGEAHGYPAFAGFELEDGIYLLAPVTWLGYLGEFFVAACIGAAIYVVVNACLLVRLHARGAR